MLSRTTISIKSSFVIATLLGLVAYGEDRNAMSSHTESEASSTADHDWNAMFAATRPVADNDGKSSYENFVSEAIWTFVLRRSQFCEKQNVV